MDAPLMSSTACLGDQEIQPSSIAAAHMEESLKEVQATTDTLQQTGLPNDSNNQNVSMNVEPMKVDDNPVKPDASLREDDDYPVLDLEMEEIDDDDDGSFDYNESNNTNASLHEKLEPAGPSNAIRGGVNSNDNNQQAPLESERPRRMAAVRAQQHLANVVAGLEPIRSGRSANRSNRNANNSRRRRKASLQVRTRSRSSRNMNNRRRKKKQSALSRSRSKLRTA